MTRTRSLWVLVAAVAPLAVALACPRAGAAGEPPARALVPVDVPGDAEVLVVPAATRGGRALVYLHGMCSDPRDDLEAWGAIARDHGPILALSGDVPCPDKPGRMKWTSDAAALDARIRAALAAVGASLTGPLAPGESVVIGESMGAARTELLATRYPDRYSRAVLVGAPQAPSPRSFRGARAIATVAAEHEDTSKMRAGARALNAAGVRARYWTLPGARHGTYGPEGARVMAEAVAFVTQ